MNRRIKCGKVCRPRPAPIRSSNDVQLECPHRGVEVVGISRHTDRFFESNQQSITVRKAMAKVLLLASLCITAFTVNPISAQSIDQNTLETCLNKEHFEENKFAAWSKEEEIRFSACQKAADEGHAEAQYNLGQMYRYMRWRNYAEALAWHRRAAEQGHSKAQRELASMYELGSGVPRNYEEAVKWYIRAAEQGEEEALTDLHGLVFFRSEQATPKAYFGSLKYIHATCPAGRR